MERAVAVRRGMDRERRVRADDDAKAMSGVRQVCIGYYAEGKLLRRAYAVVVYLVFVRHEDAANWCRSRSMRTRCFGDPGYTLYLPWIKYWKYNLK
jgi:hypothetical protein